MKKKTLLILLSMFCLTHVAAKCDDSDDEVDIDDPESVCDYLIDLCGDKLYDGSLSACEADVESMPTCRRECATDHDDCDSVDQCLWWEIGYDGAGDSYCSDGNGGGGPADMEDCANTNCSWQFDACGLNGDCSRIFDDDLANCSDWDCVESCANASYPAGIEDFNTLWTCLNESCAEFL